MKLTLLIAGKPTTFYQASIGYSLENLAHKFTCTIAPIAIFEPLNVAFYLENQCIFLGQIDNIRSSTSSSEYAIELSGRSMSANMIDSRITMDAEYDQPLDKILSKVALDFGLTVHCDIDVEKLKQVGEFQINAESPIDNLVQLVREQGFLLLERNGKLVIEHHAHREITSIALEVGKNITSLDIERSFNTLFHCIEVQGAWDESFAVQTHALVNKNRKKVIICDQLQSTEACLSRAIYEKNLAIAKSLRTSVTLPQLHLKLAIEGLNRSIRVIDEKQNFNETLVIQSLTLSVSGSEATTAITLSKE